MWRPAPPGDISVAVTDGNDDGAGDPDEHASPDPAADVDPLADADTETVVGHARRALDAADELVRRYRHAARRAPRKRRNELLRTLFSDVERRVGGAAMLVASHVWLSVREAQDSSDDVMSALGEVSVMLATLAPVLVRATNVSRQVHGMMRGLALPDDDAAIDPDAPEAGPDADP